jgi:hypothetical protein
VTTRARRTRRRPLRISGMTAGSRCVVSSGSSRQWLTRLRG